MPRSEAKTITYVNPIPVSVVIQPVDYLNEKWVLGVVRNGTVKNGGIALPGGYVENNRTGKEGGCEELIEETGVKAKPEDLIYVYEVSSRLLQSQSPNSRLVLVYKSNKILPFKDIDMNFRDNKQEIQRLCLLKLNDTGDGLINETGDDITLCFPSHHSSAIRYLSGQYEHISH